LAKQVPGVRPNIANLETSQQSLVALFIQKNQ
jgi:hypothetical protein